MKLQFKEQDFQIPAVRAVLDSFAGQTLKTGRFILERSEEIVRKAKLAAAGATVLDFNIAEDIGYRNSPIQIPESHIPRMRMSLRLVYIP